MGVASRLNLIRTLSYTLRRVPSIFICNSAETQCDLGGSVVNRLFSHVFSGPTLHYSRRAQGIGAGRRYSIRPCHCTGILHSTGHCCQWMAISDPTPTLSSCIAIDDSTVLSPAASHSQQTVWQWASVLAALQLAFFRRVFSTSVRYYIILIF